ncbi:hypothetical protein DKG77_03485 [Flagellimonas aquimarina]|uniref:Uncharacterized protein n=1 Tax=Flagellimonas aquimarina TaxID=2201895 RepID=A0A316L4S3_9FLAO|nr:hypothetical protein DKG77_03485 [Allomuricauda koreensis]
MASSVTSEACNNYWWPLDANWSWSMLRTVPHSYCERQLLGIKYKVNLDELAVALCGYWGK